MNRRRCFRAAAVTLVAALAASAGAAAQAQQLTVTADPPVISASLGNDFRFRTTVSNRGDVATPALIAHLNILSLRGDVYVDPEDWSTQRTQYLGTISGGSSRTLTWTLKGVNGGSLAAYVAVLPQASPSRPPATSPTVRITVAQRRTLNSGGILPVTLGVPVFLGLLAGAIRVARRRR